MRSDNPINSINPFDPAEPARDAALAAVLRQATGEVPLAAVDWDGLASRITRALPQRMTTSWWSYAQRWERRMLPLALAAGLAGTIALWSNAEPSATAATQVVSSDVVADVAAGAPADAAAQSFARSVTSDVSIADEGTQ